jgi:phosphatidylglycerol---prolipoprotein diacylglyceryl transferase
LFALYVVGYALGRLWVEALRIDPASRIVRLRVNIWISIITLVITVAWLVATGQRATRTEPEATDDQSDHHANNSS